MQENINARDVKPLPHPSVYSYAAIAAIVVIIDEFLKFFALSRLPGDETLVNPGWIAFAIHKNFGIAFDLPFKLPLIIIVSLVIGFFLIRLIVRHASKRPDIAVSAAVVVIGALGNLYDRVVYGFTVDYLILFGRSAINLSDIVILTGVLSLMVSSRRSKPVHKLSPEDIDESENSL